MSVVVRLADTVDASPAQASAEARSAASEDGRRWVAVGRSSERDSHSAGREAASAALAGADAKLLVAFCSDEHELPRLVAGIRDQASDAALIGCTTAGEIAADGPGDGGVIVAALGGPGFNVRSAAGPVGEDGLRSAGAAAASCIRELPESRHQVLMLLAQGVGGDTQEIVRGVHQIVGAAVPLVGGCAGDGMKMERTFQLHGDEVLTDGVVAAAIGSDAPIGIGWRHGWERVGEPMLITSCSENRVVEIDDRPALDAYLERLDAPAQVRSDAGEFTRWARTHPLGLGRRRSGQEPVRCVNEAGFEDRTLGCTAAVPEGGMAWFMHGDADSLLRSAEGSCADAIDGLRGLPPIGLFAFDCIGRRGVLGEEGIRTEVERIEAVGGAPVAGLYTYGEIARRRGVNAVHSQTLVSLAFA
jgi:hypothetical protein